MPTKSPKTIADEITNPLSFTTRDGHTIDFDPAKPAQVEFAKAFIAEQTVKTSQALTEEDRLRLQESELEFRRKELEALRHREALMAATPPKKEASPLFSKYVDAYLTLIKNSQLNERIKNGYTGKLKVFQGCIGKSATLADITSENILDFKMWLAKDDPVSDRKAIAPRSIDEYSNVISNMYKNVIKKAADNPIEGRLVGKKERMKSNRKPFTPDELTRIFDPERLAQVKSPADFFVPILGLLTGLRPSTLCQLRVGSFRHDEGLLVFIYHDYLEGNHAKTTSTNRIIPVHPLLEQVGFLRYLEDVKSLPQTNSTILLFPWLNEYEQGYADVPTQNFRKVPEDFRSHYIGHENYSVNNRTNGGTTQPHFLLEHVILHLQFDEIQWVAIQYKSDVPAMITQMDIAERREKAKVKRGNA